MYKQSFFSLREMQQPVNQWICIAFLCLICFWFTLYYLTERAEIIAEDYIVSVSTNVGSRAENLPGPSHGRAGRYQN